MIMISTAKDKSTTIENKDKNNNIEFGVSDEEMAEFYQKLNGKSTSDEAIPMVCTVKSKRSHSPSPTTGKGSNKFNPKSSKKKRP